VFLKDHFGRWLLPEEFLHQLLQNVLLLISILLEASLLTCEA
jgi:hypothetical protein